MTCTCSGYRALSPLKAPFQCEITLNQIGMRVNMLQISGLV